MKCLWPSRVERIIGVLVVDYRSSGVDIDEANQAVRRIRDIAQKTFNASVLSDIGSFGGLFQPDLGDFEKPVLVASADGVGTKLKVAFLANRHNTVGIDLVNHCVNDVLVQGARPLFFLDYLATGRLRSEVSTSIVEGIAQGCSENSCALLGGETAEMPGFYADGEYDLAGFVVGLVDRKKLIDGRTILPGDVLLGLPSSGLHTNGFSLARKIVFDILKFDIHTLVESLGSSVGDAFLCPHKSYLKPVTRLIDSTDQIVKGIAHITGGGLTENLPRILPIGMNAHVQRDKWVVPEVFRFLQIEGSVPVDDMYRTFNMGIGMVLVVPSKSVEDVCQSLVAAGESGVRVTLNSSSSDFI